MSEALVKGLLDPANRQILNIVLIGLGVVILFVMAVVVYLAKKQTLDYNFAVGPVRLILRPANATEALATKASYRKLLYVKVTHLSDRSLGGAPAYYRIVDRLDPSERSVPVYDEAVYNTLEIYPSERPLSSRTDRSSGVVDSRIVVPWQDQIEFRDAGAARIKEMVQINVADTDAVFTASHFINGLQGPSNQEFSSYLPEDSNDFRLIVDFSSIPNADKFISLKNAFIDRKFDNRPHAVGTAPVGHSLYTVSCTDGKKGDVLRMCFNFDWSRLSSNQQS
ncbi:hypothetical protein BH10ACI4_BH10ACI4_13000 [soil metagenome]